MIVGGKKDFDSLEKENVWMLYLKCGVMNNQKEEETFLNSSEM